MDILRKFDELGEAIDRCITSTAPWLIGFSCLYLAGHLITAFLKGWL